MGAYLSVAKKEKESSDGTNGSVKYGVSSMQGWRIGMEDAHSAILDIDDATSFFAVYDGHGGKAVAQFCSRHLHEVLISSEEYKNGSIENALKSTFLKMDEIMLKDEFKEELTALASGADFPKGNVVKSIAIVDSEPKDGSPLEVPSENPKPNSTREKTSEGGNGSLEISNLGSEDAAGGKTNEVVVSGEDDDEEEFFVEAEEIVEESHWSLEEGRRGNLNEAVTAGCTAVVALLQRGNLIVANAGDSRCVLSSRGVAIEMSRDHKPELPEERARIEKARGFVEFGRVNGSLALSRALGDLEYKRNYQLEPSEQMVTALPEIRLRKLEEGDEFVVLACDGIWDVMSSQEVVDFVRERLRRDPQYKLSLIVEELFEQCIAPSSEGNGLGMDNMSAVIVLLGPLASS